jgi:hypothetical protein
MKNILAASRVEDCGVDGEIFADWKDEWTGGWDKHIFPPFKHIMVVRRTYPDKDH